MQATRLTDPILLKIFERLPPSVSIFKDPGPRPGVEYDNEIAEPFMRWFDLPPEFMAGKDVLDVGCGYGGRPTRWAELGARVSGVEIKPLLTESTAAFAASKGVSIDARVGTGESIPFDNGSFDLVAMYDVMEHVVSPEEVVSEIWRVLRPGGCAMLVFPPYYHLYGGSHLHGYATRVPGLNLLFSTRALRSATQKHLDRQGHPWHEFLRDEPTDKLWNMNGLTIHRFNQIVASSEWRADTRYRGHAGVRIARLTGPKKRLMALAYGTAHLLAQIPIVREAFCLRVVAVLMKPEPGVVPVV